MHDILDLDRRGIPGAFIATVEFEQAAAAQGESLGFHPYRLFVEHPIQDRTDDEMRIIAESAFPDVLNALVEQTD
ncbi:MAG: hypothetical protein ISP92_05380 [Pseudomonadales bacterium]|nr:hypothetical protein [Pseudomonadales bacterium]MDA0761519.1 hypothetical protein [Pseudomonadota bacterium]MDA0957600.1 hypothetical protein [Pseudomonadota bacterium]